MVVLLKLFPIEFSYTDYDMKSLIFSLAFIPSANPSGIGDGPLHTVGWTLYFEMMFYTIITASLLLSKNRAIRICSILLLSLPTAWPTTFPFSQILSSTRLYEFFAGIVVAVTVASSWFRLFSKYQIVLLLSSMAVGLLCIRHFYLYSAAFIVFSTVLINKYINKDNFLVKYCIKAGDYSYSTYLIHVFVLGIALHYCGTELELLEEATLLIGLSALVYILSRYSYLLLEQNQHLLLLMRYMLKS